jgi:hypothetical protein
VHSWSTFGARMNHGRIRTHKTHHNPDLGEATTFPLIVYSVHVHKTNIQMTFFPRLPSGTSKFPELRFPQLWGHITLCAYFRFRWGLKKSYSLRWELSNGMSHATCTHGNRDDSQLLVVDNQINNLTLGPSFRHNLCFKCSNVSYKPILDIYIPRAFQWYKEILNPIVLAPAIIPWRFKGPLGLQLSKLGVHLGVWRFNSHTFPYSQPPKSMKCDS